MSNHHSRFGRLLGVVLAIIGVVLLYNGIDKTHTVETNIALILGGAGFMALGGYAFNQL